MNRVIIFGRIDFKDKRAINLARSAYIKYCETMAKSDLAFQPTELFGEDLEAELTDTTEITFDRHTHELADKTLHNTLIGLETLMSYAIAGNVFIYVLEVGELPRSQTLTVRNDKSVSHAYHAGMEAAENQQYEDAIASFSKAIKRYPRHAWAINERGLSYLELDRLEEAEQDFNLAKEIYPALPNPHYGLAKIYAARGEYEKAIQACARAMQGSIPHQPGHWLSAFLQAEIYLTLLEEDQDINDEQRLSFYRAVRLLINRYEAKLKRLGSARNKYYPTPEALQKLQERFERLPVPAA